MGAVGSFTQIQLGFVTFVSRGVKTEKPFSMFVVRKTGVGATFRFLNFNPDLITLKMRDTKSVIDMLTKHKG